MFIAAAGVHQASRAVAGKAERHGQRVLQSLPLAAGHRAAGLPGQVQGQEVRAVTVIKNRSKMPVALLSLEGVCSPSVAGGSVRVIDIMH